MQHELKILPQYLKEVWDMKKSFELRKMKEIILEFLEWMPDNIEDIFDSWTHQKEVVEK